MKYAGKTGFSLPFSLKRALRKYAGEMGRCPSSRLTEEVFKILQCGNARKIFEDLMHYGIFPHILPEMSKLMYGKEGEALYNRWMVSLDRLDETMAKDADTPRHMMLAHFMEPFLSAEGIPTAGESLFLEVFKAMKGKFFPITPPNKEVEAAVRVLFKVWKIQAPRHRKRKHRRPRRPGSKNPEERKIPNQGAGVYTT